ncbi:MAG: phenylacetate--CoA ligase family protein [Candidatus Bathyarchaeota archaeon]|nr:MAG: phenylacetate--CoA ligase family protein [Candidatus Bathyarchaeota archaeon]
MTNYFRALWYLTHLLRHVRWSRQRLLEYQNQRLRRVLRYAYDYVPFYRRKFKESGVHPNDVKTRLDLNQLPIIRKNEIRANAGDMISRAVDRTRLLSLSTSGSTGEPLFLYVTQAESEYRKAKHLRANINCGQRPRDRWVTITAPHHFAESSKLQRQLGIFVPTPISVFTDPASQVSEAEALDPDVLDGYSSSLFLLAKTFREQRKATIHPRFIVGGAELGDDYSRHFVEKTLEAPFYDQYSSVEFERMAWQCPCRAEYHIDADAIIIEFLDGCEDVSSGEKGEIVCTSLFNYAMPLIRYAIGDIGVPSSGSCQCGRSLPLMHVVEGRKDSLLVLPNGRTLTPRAFTIGMHMFQYYRQVDQFRVIQRRLDVFELQIKMKPTGVTEAVLEAALVSHLKRVLALDEGLVEFQVNFLPEIPVHRSGKLMAVISECH